MREVEEGSTNCRGALEDDAVGLLAVGVDDDDEDVDGIDPLLSALFCLSSSSRIFLCWSIFPDDGLLNARLDPEDMSVHGLGEETLI